MCSSDPWAWANPAHPTLPNPHLPLRPQLGILSVPATPWPQAPGIWPLLSWHPGTPSWAASQETPWPSVPHVRQSWAQGHRDTIRHVSEAQPHPAPAPSLEPEPAGVKPALSASLSLGGTSHGHGHSHSHGPAAPLQGLKPWGGFVWASLGMAPGPWLCQAGLDHRLTPARSCVLQGFVGSRPLCSLPSVPFLTLHWPSMAHASLRPPSQGGRLSLFCSWSTDPRGAGGLLSTPLWDQGSKFRLCVVPAPGDLPKTAQIGSPRARGPGPLVCGLVSGTSCAGHTFHRLLGTLSYRGRGRLGFLALGCHWASSGCKVTLVLFSGLVHWGPGM